MLGRRAKPATAFYAGIFLSTSIFFFIYICWVYWGDISKSKIGTLEIVIFIVLANLLAGIILAAVYESFGYIGEKAYKKMLDVCKDRQQLLFTVGFLSAFVGIVICTLAYWGLSFTFSLFNVSGAGLFWCIFVALCLSIVGFSGPVSTMILVKYLGEDKGDMEL